MNPSRTIFTCLFAVTAASGCAHLHDSLAPQNFVYTDPNSLSRYAATLAPQIAFNHLPGKQWDHLRLFTIEYAPVDFEYRAEHAAVTFIDQPSVSVGTNDAIEYNILQAQIEPSGRFRFMTRRDFVMPGTNDVTTVVADLLNTAQFNEPNFYRDLAAQSLVANSTNAEISAIDDLEVRTITYDYFAQPQKVDVEFVIRGSGRQLTDGGYVWRGRIVKMSPSGQIAK